MSDSKPARTKVHPIQNISSKWSTFAGTGACPPEIAPCPPDFGPASRSDSIRATKTTRKTYNRLTQ